MKRLRLLAINALIGVLLLAAACTNQHAHEEEAAHEAEEAEPVVVTAFSPKSELFMEFDSPVAGEKAGFLVHLTRLSDFKPVTSGALKLIFAPSTGAPLEVDIPAPARPGIYKTDVALPAPGSYALTLVTSGKGFEDRIAAPEVRVAAKGEKPQAPAAHGGGGISFLKEQQWVIDFMVAPPTRRPMAVGFSVAGELIPVSNAEATVSAPLPGVLSVSKALPYPGQKVAKGEVVAVIEPPVGQVGGYGQLAAEHAQAKSRLKLAQSEHERARKLVEGKIAPRKRLEEAQAALEAARAAYAPFEQAMAAVRGAGANRIVVRAPIGGTVVEVLAGNGKGIAADEPILRVVDTSRLWLKANVPASEAGTIESGRVAGTTFTVTGLEKEFSPSKLVSTGAVIDPQTRTLPVLFEVENGSGQLKAGMFANVSVRTGQIDNVLAVPRESLIEDEGRWFVFIQSSGEAFDRREVKVGIEDAGSVQITGGLKEDERVVTRGAYYVKRAESAAKGGADQGHAH